MNKEELVAGVAEDLFAYVMRGNIAEQRILPELKPSGLDERFESFETLVDLHFILRPEVVQFIQNLPQHLRSIKTHTENVQKTTHGEISGRIDWDATMKTRYSKGPNNQSLFVCSDRHESYDIDENIVLKRLLSVIYTTLGDCEQYLRTEPEWMTARWEKNLELVNRFRNLFERNVHLVRIRDPKTYEPTDRMIETAESARNEVYREAASLLRDHRRSRTGDEASIRELLQKTLITPDDEETLFELYVLFRYVEAIENHQKGSTTVSTIETDRQEVARIESSSGSDVILYHDNSARDRDLSFIAEPIEKSDAELTRAELIQRESRRAVDKYFSNRNFETSTNRPDVIVLEIRHNDEYTYLITEVKYSSRPETIRDGVSETLEYLAFLRRDNQIVFPDDSPFGSGWNGVLVVQDIEEFQTAPLNNQRGIRIVQASELDELLPEVLERVL